MRISDWSSDVCSSDLSENFKRVRLSVGPELAIFGRIDFPAKQGGFHDGFPGPDRPKGLPGKADGVQGGKAIGEKWQAYRMILEPLGRFMRKGQAGSEYRVAALRSEEHTSELQSLMRISYAVFCLKKQKNH